MKEEWQSHQLFKILFLLGCQLNQGAESNAKGKTNSLSLNTESAQQAPHWRALMSLIFSSSATVIIRTPATHTLPGPH